MRRVQQVVERGDLGQGLHPRGHALVAVAAAELGQAQAVGLDQSRTGLGGALQELAHARVAARRFEIDFDDGFRRGFQAHAHGMEAVKHFGRRHRPIIDCLL